jgi:RNA polymerase sigma-70 factor (ECF subfamily)
MTIADFESMVHEHQRMVFSIALNFFHNPALAEEVAQEVFLQLYENCRSVATGSHCVAWLRRSTVHRCIDAMRRASFRQEVQVETMPELPVNVPESDPLLQEGLRRVIASLPENPRAVLILRFGEGMEVEDIGKSLDMPIGTVKSNLHRGVAMIREKAARYLKEHEHEPSRTRSS